MASIRDRRQTVLALHGFALGGAMYGELAAMIPAHVEAPDLPGHGGRDATNTLWDSAVDEVIDLVVTIGPSVVVGYSMGGRLALGAALARPHAFMALVLVSTSIGIAEADDREARRRQDLAAAKLLEERGIDEFVDEWSRQPLIAGSSQLDDIRRRNSSAGLAGALRGMGQGVQPYFGDQLDRLIVPTTWVAGSEDREYAAIAERAAGPTGQPVIVSGARHNVVLDAPGEVAQAVNALL